MPILKDARGNEFDGALDQITGGVVTDARALTASLGSLNAESAMDLNGQAVAMIDARTAAASLTLAFEGTVDNVNYFGLPVFDILTEAYTAAVVITTTLAKTYVLGVSGYKRVRVRVSAYTSGSVTVALRGSRADFAIYNRPIPSTIMVTSTGASGAGSTASLVNVTGMFHYITEVELTQFVVAARTAAATPVLCTTANLPGSPVFSCDATGGTVGQIFRYQWEPTTPIKSSVAGTTTSFVAPATTNTIWRWNVAYYVGA